MKAVQCVPGFLNESKLMIPHSNFPMVCGSLSLINTPLKYGIFLLNFKISKLVKALFQGNLLNISFLEFLHIDPIQFYMVSNRDPFQQQRFPLLNCVSCFPQGFSAPFLLY